MISVPAHSSWSDYDDSLQIRVVSFLPSDGQLYDVSQSPEVMLELRRASGPIPEPLAGFGQEVR